jgi:hypothetical protein
MKLNDLKIKPKTCRECKQKFIPIRAIQPVCSDFKCMVAFANKAAEKAALAREKKAKREHKAKLTSIKPWQKWFNECKSIAQKYVRVRDRFDGCISCDKPPHWHGQWHGSHFKPAGNFKAVALNLMNIHKACSECNNYKSGNGVEYNDKLILKIGQAKVDWLKSQTQPHRHSVEYLQRYKKVMGKRLRQMEKRIEKGNTNAA